VIYKQGGFFRNKASKEIYILALVDYECFELINLVDGNRWRKGTTPIKRDYPFLEIPDNANIWGSGQSAVSEWEYLPDYEIRVGKRNEVKSIAVGKRKPKNSKKSFRRIVL